MPDCTAFGFTSPPLPAWQLGSAWINASRKQTPFQSLMGGSEARGWGAGLGGCAGEEHCGTGEDSPMPPGSADLWVMKELKSPLPTHCTLMMCTLGPSSSIPFLQEKAW